VSVDEDRWLVSELWAARAAMSRRAREIASGRRTLHGMWPRPSVDRLTLDRSK
jgi:hypothetical protein